MDRAALLAKEFREFKEEAGRRFDQIEAMLRAAPAQVEPAAAGAPSVSRDKAPAETSK